MDLAELIQKFSSPIIVLICLTIGFVIKKLEYVPNKFIPLIMFVLGSIFGFITHGWNFDAFVMGAVSGVASTGMYELFKQTGMYELFKQLIKKGDKDDTA